MNIVVLIGRVAREPDLRYTATGVANCTFTVAVDRPFKNQSGEREADFISVSTWRMLAEFCANHLRKGSMVAVEGRLQTRSYENKEGRKVNVTEVVANEVRFLDRKKAEGEGNTSSPPSPQGNPVEINDSDLPF